jgi:NADH dehydrogenase
VGAGDGRRRPHVVVVGGGFGGFFAALRLERELRRAGGAAPRVTLLSESNVMLYTPFLPQAAGGTLEPRHVTVPLRGPLRRTDVLLGEAVGRDAERRRLSYRTAGGDLRTLDYDHLVVAPGSVSRTLPVPGLAEAAVGFKTLPEAIHLRNRSLRLLEIATTTEDAAERAALLTFVFVGGGYAGVEALAELEDLLREAKALHPALRDAPMRWVLVEATESIFPEVGARLSAYAMRQLHGRGIDLRLGTTVTDATGGRVVLSGGEKIACRTLVWTTGVRPHPSVAAMALPTDATGRIPVDATLAVHGCPGVWAVGDAAAVPDPARPQLSCP